MYFCQVNNHPIWYRGVYPPPPWSFGIMGLAGECALNLSRQRTYTEIFRNKGLGAVLSFRLSVLSGLGSPGTEDPPKTAEKCRFLGQEPGSNRRNLSKSAERGPGRRMTGAAFRRATQALPLSVRSVAQMEGRSQCTEVP
jgi:hypothetical protein